MQNLITDHLDIWTTAHKTRSTAGRGSNNKLNLHGIKKLRELILELAVRGKLVPQDANDEPASELLKKIAVEKTKLIKEGKIKKEKSLPEIADEEKPFQLPSSWVWAQLGDITNFGSTTKIDVIDENRWVLDLEDIEKDTSKLIQKIRFSERGSLSDKNAFLKGDVLYGKLRPYLNKVIVADEEGVCTTEILPIRCYGDFDSHYFKLALKSPSFVSYVNARSYGMKMPRLGTDDGRRALIALPPLPEQHRIVSKVDELMAFCDQLEQTQSDNIAAHAQLVEALLATLTNSSDHNELQNNWQRIAAHFDTLFTTEHSIDQLKQTILQLAVMGKLCSQNPNDEPASELLKKIAVEKTKLIKEGKIKKEKSLPEIADEEKPFQLPSSWVWAQLGDITNFGSTTKIDVIDENRWVLDLEDIEKDTSKLIQKIRFSERGSLSDKNAFLKGDVLYGKLRPYLNKVIVADEEGVCTTEILPIRCYGDFDSHYFKLALKSPSFVSYVNARSYGTNGAQYKNTLA